MKKKVQIATLLALVISIWGYIGFKVAGNFSGETDLRPLKPINLPYSQKTKGSEEVYNLNLNYKDPFLKPKGRKSVSNSTSKPTPGEIAKNKKRPKKIPMKSIPWPQVRFKGLVEKKSGKEVLYIIEINRVNYFFSQKEIILDLKLVQAASDSIQLEFLGKEKRVYKIN